MSTDEEKYKNLRNQLRLLPRMRAKKNFDSRLFARIKELENAKHIRPVQKPDKENVFVNWLANLLKPSLVPAIGLTVVLLAAVVVYFSFYNKLNQQDVKVSQEISYADKNGEFVIYVKKDGERVYDETNREITSADIEGSTSTDYRAPSDVSAETIIPKTNPDTYEETHDKLDRISPEQKFEMEKESKIESDEIKIRSKGDDGIMKKGNFNKEEKKDAPSNYIREKANDSGTLDDENNINPSQEIKQQTDKDEEDQKETNRLAERKKASKKDSLKVKDKKIEGQDSIEK